MTKRRAACLGVLAVLLVGIAWAFGLFGGSDPAIAELQQIGSQMRDQNLSEAQRNQLRDDFRQRMGSLTDDQRRTFFDSNRGRWTGRMQERMDEFFKMSKADQQKRLDEVLDRLVKDRNSQPGATGGNQNNRGAGRGGRNMTDAQREERAKRRLDQTNPKMRAEFSQFRKQLDQRAQQRGINLGNQQGWGFRGPGRGV